LTSAGAAPTWTNVFGNSNTWTAAQTFSGGLTAIGAVNINNTGGGPTTIGNSSHGGAVAIVSNAGADLDDYSTGVYINAYDPYTLVAGSNAPVVIGNGVGSQLIVTAATTISGTLTVAGTSA